jgi:DNA polymerase-3 subunit epsilon
MLGNLLSLEFRRTRLLKKTPEGPLRAFLQVPFPSPGKDCRETEFVALDLETTGLNAARDEIISVGLVCMHGMRIDLSSARHRLVAPKQAIPETSAVIHQITDDRAATGDPIRQALEELLPLLAGKVLIAHHARVEFQFLGAACENAFGGRFLMPIVDTQWIERKAMELGNKAFGSQDMRLGRIRERYNLPRYRAHDALSDALAAAELFAAQLAERDRGAPLPLKRFLLKI